MQHIAANAENHNYQNEGICILLSHHLLKIIYHIHFVWTRNDTPVVKKFWFQYHGVIRTMSAPYFLLILNAIQTLTSASWPP
jgi:uncharacterized protein YqhQ